MRKINYIGLGSRAHYQKAKIKKDTKNDNYGPIRKPRTPENHKSMISHYDVIRKRDQRTGNKGNIYSDNQTQGIKNPYKKKLENRNS